MAGKLIIADTGKMADVKNIFSANLIQRWLKFAAVSDKSVTTYTVAIKQMCRYFYANNITTPRREDLETWRDGLIDGGKSANTVRLYIASAKLFFRWLAMENLYPNVADHLKAKVKISAEHKKDFLSKEQSRELLNFAKGKGTLKDLRDRAIIALMLSAGLRTIEICRADVKDIRRLSGVNFLFVQGKGRSEKSESVRLAPQVFSLIQSYLKARGKVKGTDPLFVSTSNRCKNQRLDTQTIRKLIKADLRAIGLDSDRLTAHSLRHTCATQALLNGAKLEYVQQTLRHRQISTTMIYNHAIERIKNTAECVVADTIFSTT